MEVAVAQAVGSFVAEDNFREEEVARLLEAR